MSMSGKRDKYDYQLRGRIINYWKRYSENSTCRADYKSNEQIGEYFCVSKNYVRVVIRDHKQSLEGFEIAAEKIVKKYPGLFLKETKAIAA